MREGESVDEFLERVLREGTPATSGPMAGAVGVPQMTLSEYRELVRPWTRPSPEQIEAFARYVSAAHSWYKHITWRAPGAPFVFLVNPCVMMEDTPPRDGVLYRFRERKEGENHFHYRNQPTSQYVESFGHLDFAHPRQGLAIPAPDLEQPEPGLVHAHLRCIPDEVMHAGTVSLTALMHPYCATPFFWVRLDPEHYGNGLWPEESGGRAHLERIVAYCDAHEKDLGTWDHRSPYPELEELLRPERERQLSFAIGAIGKVVSLLWPDPRAERGASSSSVPGQ